MAHQRDDTPDVDAERPTLVWTVWKGHIIMVHTVAALTSERVPDLILSYVFLHHAEETLS